MPSFETAARFPEPACSTFPTMALLGSGRLQALSPANTTEHPYAIARLRNCRIAHLTFNLLEARQIRLAVAGYRSTGKEPLRRSLIGSLLLDDRGLIRLLARHIRHHQFPELHKLLHLLVA